MARQRPRIAVLCSGHGSNLQALIDATRRGRLAATIALVVSDRGDAYALRRARRAGLPTRHLDPAHYPTRAAFDAALVRALVAARVRLVCLAGFMRIVGPGVVRRFRHRILNVHPALLPAFPGAHAIRDALAHGVQVTGVTVHIVDEGVDTGPIILQEALAIREGESADALVARVHRIEHRLYPAAVRLLLAGRLQVRGRRVSLDCARDNPERGRRPSRRMRRR